MKQKSFQYTLLGLCFLVWGPYQSISAEAIKWYPYNEGIALAKSEKKNVFLHFYADWCYYCKMMTNKTFKNSPVITFLNSNFVAIRINSDKNSKLASKYGVRGLPTTWFLNADGTKFGPIPGYIPPEKFDWWADRMAKAGQTEGKVLLRPIRRFTKIIVVLMAFLVWLDNLGFNISTLLTGLGVGGIAVALAAQDTLKNFLGSVMVLLDKPYGVGQRIVIKGHDGIVEEIGLRSTKLRLLTGHQTTVPNEEMARSDIENIGRRPHIRRLFNVTITYDTPPDKVEGAVDIIEKILENHEGMNPEFPPRVYFNNFNPASLNLMVIYWYHPAAYWEYMAHCQQVNLQIMREFEKEGIKFAFPTQTAYLTQPDGQALDINLMNQAITGPGETV